MKLEPGQIKVMKRHRKDVGDLAELMRSISEVGLLHPIVVDGDNRLVAGFRRLQALKKLGVEQIPVTVARNIDERRIALRAEAQENTCRLAMAPTEMLSLAQELEEREEADANARKREGQRRGGETAGKGRPKDSSVGTSDKAKPAPKRPPKASDATAQAAGCSARTMAKIAEVVQAAEEDPSLQPIVEKMDRTRKVDAAHRAVKQHRARKKVEEQAKTATERAAICLKDASKFLAEFEPHSIDLLLTDPPYSTDIDDIDRFSCWLTAATPKLKSTGRAYICIGAYPRELLAYLERLRQAQWLDKSQVLVWTYRNTLGPSPTSGYKLNWQAILYLAGKDAPPLDCPVMTEQFSVQDINAPDGRLGDRYHAWQKPTELGERFVRHSTRPGDLVVDPFAGTGTFLLAAALLGRKATGCDLSEENIAIAVERGCLRE